MLSVEDIKYRAANSPKNVSTILPKKMQSKVYSLKKKSVLPMVFLKMHEPFPNREYIDILHFFEIKSNH